MSEFYFVLDVQDGEVTRFFGTISEEPKVGDIAGEVLREETRKLPDNFLGGRTVHGIGHYIPFNDVLRDEPSLFYVPKEAKKVNE